MIKYAISDTSREGIQSSVQPSPATLYTYDDGLSVTLMLSGHHSDIQAVVEHWGIKVDRRAWPPIGQIQNQYIVKGRLV